MRFQIIIQSSTGESILGSYDTVLEAAPKLRKVIDAFDQGDIQFESTFPGCSSIELWMHDTRLDGGKLCIEQY